MQGIITIDADTREAFKQQLDEAADTINERDGSLQWSDRIPSATRYMLVIFYEYDEGESRSLAGFQPRPDP